ncbi:hypothetical protein B0T26DRAFT_184178 [Lasiosphaeria miniovina]|uniref:Uncharacterized protein n=1 Tax=Lasiosphaeria miniovina TaxID=1954250 RepID=A0AA40B7D4_9PEZI|nr:uncharacterized protein B0T26DRAFT_184178 [Lasiosphaeria miniovina]KAK0728723.1 hypothetical protein B0T26DRAFT_184178 [Lasiosphaeria miniovina]
MVTRIIVGAVQVGGSLFLSLHASLPNPLRSLGAMFLVLHRLFLDWHNLDCSPLIRLVLGLANQSRAMDMHDKARFCQHCGRRLLPLEPSAFCRTSGLHDVIRKSAVPQPGLSSTRCPFTRQVDFFFFAHICSPILASFGPLEERVHPSSQVPFFGQVALRILHHSQHTQPLWSQHNPPFSMEGFGASSCFVLWCWQSMSLNIGNMLLPFLSTSDICQGNTKTIGVIYEAT